MSGKVESFSDVDEKPAPATAGAARRIRMTTNQPPSSPESRPDGNAVGGVVNVITHRIETDLPTEPVRGSLEVRRGSAADDWARGAVFDFALKPAADRAVVFHVDAFRRTTENLRLPGFAESARVRDEETAEALEHGEPAPAFAHG
eukprot:gene5617-7174_t